MMSSGVRGEWCEEAKRGELRGVMRNGNGEWCEEE